MSVDKYIITKDDTQFSIIPNNVAQGLPDAEVLGLWIYLQSLPPNWVFHKSHLRNHFQWGRDKLDKKLTILKQHNLVEPIGIRDETGKFTQWTLHVKDGRDFTTTHNTENPCSGELSTGLYKNSTHNTEKPAAAKPVTGFSTPIKETKTKAKDFRKKSFCAVAPEKPRSQSKSDWKAENAKVHAFAESKNQMAREAKHIEQHEAIKRVPIPEEFKDLVKKLKRRAGVGCYGNAKDGGRLQESVV